MFVGELVNVVGESVKVVGPCVVGLSADGESVIDCGDVVGSIVCDKGDSDGIELGIVGNDTGDPEGVNTKDGPSEGRVVGSSWGDLVGSFGRDSRYSNTQPIGRSSPFRLPVTSSNPDLDRSKLVNVSSGKRMSCPSSAHLSLLWENE